MSTASKIGLPVVLVVVVAVGIWYAGYSKSGTVYAPSAVNYKTEETPKAPQTSIGEDFLSVDAEIKALEQDSSEVDKSLNDQPVEQTE